jgi:Co/Zn/Cd efflux system component
MDPFLLLGILAVVVGLVGVVVLMKGRKKNVR